MNSSFQYTREEIEGFGESKKPDRGEYCPKCKNYIPEFSGLTKEEEKRIRSLSPAASMKAIRDLTGCNLMWAKIWYLHPVGPHQSRIGPPCPYCGATLFSEKTKQCLKCGWDWHDPENPVQSKTNQAEQGACHNADKSAS